MLPLPFELFIKCVHVAEEAVLIFLHRLLVKHLHVGEGLEPRVDLVQIVLNDWYLLMARGWGHVHAGGAAISAELLLPMLEQGLRFLLGLGHAEVRSQLSPPHAAVVVDEVCRFYSLRVLILSGGIILLHLLLMLKAASVDLFHVPEYAHLGLLHGVANFAFDFELTEVAEVDSPTHAAGLGAASPHYFILY